jgi:hypothetical protein
MEILKSMGIKAGEFSKGLVLRGLCRHTAIPYVFELVNKNGDYYICVMDLPYVGASLVGNIFENCDICHCEKITDLTIKGFFNRIIYLINNYNKEDGAGKQLQYL